MHGQSMMPGRESVFCFQIPAGVPHWGTQKGDPAVLVNYCRSFAGIWKIWDFRDGLLSIRSLFGIFLR